MAANPSIGDLTNQMKQLVQSGAGKDLSISPNAKQSYIQLIEDYRNKLHDQLNAASKLTTYANVGNFLSAVQTKEQLIDDVTGQQAFVASLTQYVAYLDEFVNAVNAAFTRFTAEDQSS